MANFDEETEDDVHGYCAECGSQQSDKYMMDSPFDSPPCKYCGGTTYVAYASQADKAKKQMDQQRNIGHNPDVKYGS